ncbi:protein-L-isoaspartate O-methyltransferase domain-containing protein 2 isoform X2 [Parasteatoda tepidariorum]|uniref:protein-L-isoaspartate O-methyltransferase domain-containing protein 2 isoform X2 n=1 Tax=Parasteatoda tepidariorum TaxID=114398 RepID=UPI001C720BA7|nr:protein-L-isoaspartate O-methyltransferase domain-containing protein 2 isoform X2 [Parasteatoda tepidariorum]
MARSLSQLFYALGGSVSPGKSNDELIDHLIDAEFIRTPAIQRVFRSVDRGNYYHPSHRQNAYKDIAWRMGNLHLSAPCVYSVVMETLKLKPGLSFLNLGSGSGYLSTMAGLLLGQYGINHGIEFHEDIVEYAYERLDEFLKNSKVVDEHDFCEPVFTCGNCLTLDANVQQYDRVYCGAACPEEYEAYIKNLVKINGILIMPLNDKLLKITRVNETNWTTVKVLSVSFAPLILPPSTKKGETIDHAKLGDITPPNLQQICRFNIRSMLRQNVEIEHPKLKLNLIKNESRPRRQVRRIVIPFFDESDLSNSQSDSDYDYDSDSPEYTISARLPTRMSIFLEDFLRRHAELQLLRQMEEDRHSSSSDSDAGAVENFKAAPNTSDSQSQTELTMETNKTEQQSSDTELFSLVTVSNIKPQNSSGESDSNFNQPPSQSTRSKRKNTLKRKHVSSNTRQHGAGASTTDSPEPKRRAKRTASTVVWKRVAELKKEKEKTEADEEDSDFTYTYFLLQKIGALPLPPFLLRYLNYRRENM